jgi:ABC-type phosphate/phosphonate transport system substrate-binding protein
VQNAGCFILIIASLAMCLLSGHAAAAAETEHGRDRPLVLGYSSEVFFNVDPRDVVGLTKVWVQTADRATRSALPSSVVMFRDMAAMEKAVRNNEVDIVVLIAEEFTVLRDKVPIDAVLSADYGKNFYDVLLLMVRQDSGVSRLEQLRGKSIRVESGQKGDIPIQWLDTYLAARAAMDAQKFFSEIGKYSKASQVVMPLFFKQTDACLASRDSLETMGEMNPQIGRSLRILETSPGFVTGLIAVRRDIANPRRDAMINAIRNMHNDAKGRQLLTLFRINRLVDFKPEHLASVERVIADHRSKVENVARRKRR